MEDLPYEVPMPTPLTLVWAATGVILTALGTLWHWTIPSPIPTLETYAFSLQVGGVLLTACLGGPWAGLYAQMGYVALGLSGIPIFSYGGGWDYVQQPAFGYLLGFMPGAWVCGWLACPPVKVRIVPRRRQSPPRRPRMWMGCLMGLGVIHSLGLLGLMFRQGFTGALWQAGWRYSLYPLPGQLLVIALVVVLTFLYRRLTFHRSLVRGISKG